MEADGIITPEQSMTYLREYSELTYGFKQEYLEKILRNYIGLKWCFFLRRVVYGKKLLLRQSWNLTNLPAWFSSFAWKIDVSCMEIIPPGPPHYHWNGANHNPPFAWSSLLIYPKRVEDSLPTAKPKACLSPLQLGWTLPVRHWLTHCNSLILER